MLNVGEKAPNFNLPKADSTGTVQLSDLLGRGPAVLAFYKYNCPTCQLTFPFLQRLYSHLAPLSKTSLVGIAQDSPSEAADFIARFKLSFDILCDVKPYSTSRAYQLVTVPTIYFVEQNGIIKKAFEAFDKKAVIELSSELHAFESKGQFEVFRPTDQVPLLKPG